MTTGNDATEPVPAEDPPGRDPGTPSPLEGQARLHNGQGRFERHPDTVERDKQAVELRAQRWTLQQIADHLGYSDKSNVRRAIERARADVARPAITQLIQTESDELDELYALALEIIHRNHVVVSHGKVICGTDGEPLLDDGPKLQAIQTALRIRDQYQNLHGLKQPAQVAVSGAVRYEVIGVNPEDLT